MDNSLEILENLRNYFPIIEKQFPEAANDFKLLLGKLKEISQLDRALIERLKDLAEVHKTPFITGDEYQNLLSLIDANTIVIYFQAANVFRVYDASQIPTDLTDHLNSDFRRNKQLYEFVPNNMPQKIVILCDLGIVSYVDTLVDYVVEFMKSKKIEVVPADIKTFKTDSGLIEILINGFYVPNYTEREKIVKELMTFIERKENSTVVTSMMNRNIVNHFDNSTMVTMPNCKVQLNGKGVEYTDVLVRNIFKCRDLTSGDVYVSIVNNKIGTVNNVTNNIKNSVINHGTITTNVKTSKPIDESEEFIEYIKTQKPEWYTPGKFISKDFLHEKYIELYGDISKPKFHKMFNNKLFDKENRITKNNARIQMVRVLDYDAL